MMKLIWGYSEAIRWKFATRSGWRRRLRPQDRRNIKGRGFPVMWVRAAFLVLICAAARAQESRGTILGRVTDSTGAVVPGASIRAVNLETNTGASGTTNAEGNFELSYLLTGTYRLEVEHTGFKKFVRAPLEVRVADRISVDVVLELGSVAEVMSVTAEAPLLETTTASLGLVIDRRRIIELPLPNGNPWALAQLAPGVSSYIAPGHYALPGASDIPNNLSINGTPARSAEFTLDGAPNMQQRDVAFIPPADIVEEFKVETATFDASVGYSPAGQINAVLKSGGNKVHGSLWEFNTSGPMRGTDFFTNKFIYDPNTGPITPEKIKAGHPTEVLNRYGGVLTGPLWLPKIYSGRNRTFFSYGYQGFMRRTADHDFYNVPPLKQRSGDFSELLAVGPQYQIYDPNTAVPAPGGRLQRQPFPGNIVPASRLDKMALNLLQYWPKPNAPGTIDGLQNYAQSVPFKNDYFGHTGRIDHVFSDRHRIFGRITKSELTNDANRIFSNIARGNKRGRWNNSIALDDVLVFGPSFLANFRFGANRFDESNFHNATGMDLTTLGFPAPLAAELDRRGVAFPQITVNGTTELGTDGGDRTITNYYSWAAHFTRTAGNHSVRFGGEYRILQENGINWGNVAPRLEFATNWTRGPLDNSTGSPQGIGQGLASFLLGLPTGGRIDFNPFYAEASRYAGVYIQDDWKLTPRLTVNIGLRYDYDRPTTERYNRSVRNFNFSTPNPIDAAAQANYARSPIPEVPVSDFRSIGGLLFAGVDGNPRSLWERDGNNFAPRIGIAWTPGLSWVIRAGYGIFYEQLGVNRRDVNLTGFSTSNALVASPDNGLTFTASLANPFPQGLRRPAGASGGLLTNVGQGVSFFQPDPLNPYTQRWSIGAQRSLPGKMLAEVTYVGNRGTKLGASRQLDPVPAKYLSRLPVRDQATIDFLSARVSNPYYPMLPGTGLAGSTIARSQLLRPYPHFTGITASFPAGSSWYHATQVKVEKRFSAGCTFQSSYTWSKLMEATDYLNATDSRPEHVISGSDRPHRWVTSGIYEFPFGRSRRWLRSRSVLERIAGGWQAQGIYTAQSGAPLGFGNALFYGDLHDIPLPGSGRTPDLWFNRDAGFERSAARQLANNIQAFSTRFTGVRADGNNIWNLSLLKYFDLREGLRIQLRVEAQNALNHAHFGNPNTNPVSSLFGTVTGTVGNPRLMFVGLKMAW